MYLLIRALQHEFGSTALSENFGIDGANARYTPGRPDHAPRDALVGNRACYGTPTVSARKGACRHIGGSGPQRCRQATSRVTDRWEIKDPGVLDPRRCDQQAAEAAA
jgi:hypothetical protein